MPTLRSDQLPVLDKIREASIRTRYVGVYGPTGWGKGHIISSIMRNVFDKHKNAWCITPQLNLIDDLHNRFNVWGVGHSVKASDYHHRWSHRIHLMTNAGLARFLKEWLTARDKGEWKETLEKIAVPDLIIFDEAHYGLDTQRKIFKLFPAARGLGFSGSPIGMYPTYRELVEGPSITELTFEERLVPVYTYEARPVDKSMLKLKPDSVDGFDLGYFWMRQLKHGTLVGDIIETWGKHLQDRHTIIRTGHRDIGHTIMVKLRGVGIDAVYVDAETGKDLGEIITRFQKTPGMVLIHPDLLSQGADIPRADAFISADPTRSPRVFAQNLGRIMRPVLLPGSNTDWLQEQGQFVKPNALFFDLSGWTHFHGNVYQYSPQVWAKMFRQSGNDDEVKLERHADTLERLKQLGECPQCGATVYGKNCNACGFEFIRPRKIHDISYISGVLTPVSKDVSGATRERHRREYAQLRAFANAKGYKRGWAFHQFKRRNRYEPLPEWNRDAVPKEWPDIAIWMDRMENKRRKGKSREVVNA